MDLEALPAALAAAGTRLEALPETLPAAAAAAILTRVRPPRKTAALAATGRVEDGAVMFGGGTVDYAGYVHAASPFLPAGYAAAETTILDLTAAAVDKATTL